MLLIEVLLPRCRDASCGFLQLFERMRTVRGQFWIAIVESDPSYPTECVLKLETLFAMLVTVVILVTSQSLKLLQGCRDVATVV